MNTDTQYTVDVTTVPIVGGVSLLVRLRGEDRNLINHAAEMLNLTQAQFLRMALVNLAKAVTSSLTSKTATGEAGGFASKMEKELVTPIENKVEPEPAGSG